MNESLIAGKLLVERRRDAIGRQRLAMTLVEGLERDEDDARRWSCW